jgi:sodium/hydrogen antiporter
VHGGSLMLLRRGAGAGEPGEAAVEPAPAQEDLAPAASAASADGLAPAAAETEQAPAPPRAPVPEAIGVAELLRLERSGQPVVVLDVRTDRSLEASAHTAQGAVRLHPDRAVQEAEKLHLPREAWLVAFCA